MTVDPDNRLVLICTSAGNANFRPWRSDAEWTSFTEIRTTNGGIGGGCEYSLSTDVANTVLVGCSNRTIGMALNGSDTLVLSEFFPNSGGEVTGIAALSATEFFTAANNGGVFRTTNAGADWTRIGTGMTGTDSATIRAMRKGPDGRIYATAGSGALYVYGTASAVAPAGAPSLRLRVRATPSGWLLRGTYEGERIVLRGTDGRTLGIFSATAVETRISATNLPKAMLIAEVGSKAPSFVKLSPY
jgi:hypothetical protein